LEATETKKASPQMGLTLSSSKNFTKNILTIKTTEFLQNIQDSVYNSSCCSVGYGHKLQRTTEPYQVDGDNKELNTTKGQNENKKSNLLSCLGLDNLLWHCNQDIEESKLENSTKIPKGHSVKKLKQKGKQQCGFKELANMNLSAREDNPFLSTRPTMTNQTQVP